MKVAVIGAGISGLYAGHILTELGYDVSLFEASNRVGGRIATQTIHEHLFLEMGAAEIHGNRSVIFEMLKHLDQKLEPIVGNEYIWYDQKLADLDATEHLPDTVQKLLNYFYSIEEEDYDGSVLDSLKEKGLYHPNLKFIIRGILSEYSAHVEKVHASTLGEEEWRWSSGDKNYFSWGRYSSAVTYFEDKLKDKIQLNTPIVDVNYEGEQISILTHKGETLPFDKVIVSVPLGVLKEQKINFTPSLPAEKQKAIEDIGFGKGRKLFIEFSETFWDEDLVEIIGGKKCPSYLVRPSHPKHIVAYLMGEASKELDQLEDDELAEVLLNDLQEIYPDIEVMSLYMSHHGKDWTKDPFIKGTYSYSTKGTLEGRENLKQPIENRLFFIGEACRTNGHSATVHGAMETAEELADNYFPDLKSV
ncbi:NAD(P)/FAD-dependent oxidoreductase [Flammeovirga sp. OC4]|uniref:flavin monoamine oxidase family protein n=1 Tax=Flammeovirga sp. OC4 TaxID=1382345 RepID=UPI0005C685EF|nr:NAD(P)/FAD-dependent oxidoreductase [Flammeovirga sp. OC4]